MTRKYFCDICNEEMADLDNYIKLDIEKALDVCPECLHKVKKFVLDLIKNVDLKIIENADLKIVEEEYIEEGKFKEEKTKENFVLEETQYD